MDIHQLRYLMAIVESDMNVTQAARRMYLSQSAMSKSMTALEDEFGFPLFERARGRLVSLSGNGMMIYERARVIIGKIDELLDFIEYRARSLDNSVLLGIPPLVITALFGNYFNRLKATEPSLHIDIVEYGAAKLALMMKDHKLDYAVLLSPTGLDLEKYGELPIHSGELAAYMSESHPLARKDILTWDDFRDQELMLCDETFKTHFLVRDKLEKEEIPLKSFGTAYSWDFTFISIKQTNQVTILPYVSKYLFQMEGMVEKRIVDPIPWDIVLAYRKRQEYSNTERFLYRFTKEYFSNQPGFPSPELGSALLKQ